MRLPWRRTADESADDGNLRRRLSKEQYRVTQRGGTERAFSGAYHTTETAGIYACVVCGAELFESDAKYDSGTGWPSFTGEIVDGRVDRVKDRKLGLLRIEARCANCDAHLGHVFPDGPAPTGERFCMNSASLDLRRAADPASDS